MKSFLVYLFGLCAFTEALYMDQDRRHITRLGRPLLRPRQSESESEANEDTPPKKTLVTEPYSLGSFDGNGRSVSSGDVKVIDEKTIRIKDLEFEGSGSAAYFVLGNGTDGGSTPSEFLDVDDSMIIVPDEIQSCERLTSYNGESAQLKIPGSKKVSDFSYLMIYSVEDGHNYGAVTLPTDLYFKDGEVPQGLNECSMSKAKDSSEEDSSREKPKRRQQQGLDDIVVDGVLGSIAAGAQLLSNAVDRIAF